MEQLRNNATSYRSIRSKFATLVSIVSASSLLVAGLILGTSSPASAAGITPATFSVPAVLNQSFTSDTMTVSTGASWSITAGALPTGLTLGVTSSTTDTITGTPTSSGPYNFTVTSGSNSQVYTIVVGITPNALTVPAAVGTSYTSDTMTVVTAGTWSITAGALPPGLNLTSSASSTSDTITGTPTAAGVFFFTVTGGNQAQQYSLTVSGISPTTLVYPFLGIAYNSGTMTVAAAAVWSISAGALPNGLVLNSSGSTTDTITGTPTVSGTFTFTVKSGSNTRAYTLLVSGISPATLVNPTVGTAYTSGAMTVATAATWSISSGALPPGLTLSSNVSSTTDTIVGTPTTAGTYVFTVTSGAAVQSYTLVVTGILPATVPNATVGTAYSSGTLTVTTAGAWSISAGALPSGLVLNTSSATTDSISGTPTTAGSYTFTIKSGTVAQSFTLVVTGITPTTLANATIGTPYSSGTLTVATAGTWSIAAGTLAPGLVLNASGSTTDTITGTPTTAGTYSFTIRSGTVTQVYGLTVLAAPNLLHAVKVSGHVTAGKTVIITIVGTGFYGRPTVVSHAGTVAVVTKDTGKLLTVRVTVAARSKNGTFTFTITLANGKVCRVRYMQHA
jgi:hypothetical protein